MNKKDYERLTRARRETLAYSAPQAEVTRDGVLVWGTGAEDPFFAEGAEHYDPYERPELASALEKVTDEKSALRFARSFGLPGYGEVLLAIETEAESALLDGRAPDPLLDLEALARLREEGGGRFGDPLPWIYAQARSVRLALELVEALPSGSEAIQSVGRRQATPQLGGDGHVAAYPVQLAYGLRTSEVDLAQGLLRKRRAGELPEEELRPLLCTMFVEELVNANAAGLTWRLFSPPAKGPYTLEGGFSQQGLFQVVWWHVAGAAIAGKVGAKVRLCKLESCRAPFIVTDERQRFCPAEYGTRDQKTGKRRPGRSRCAALYQKRHGGKAAS
jgi:hypothetical protein